MKYIAGIFGGAFIGALVGKLLANAEYTELFSWVVMDQYTTTGALIGAIVGLLFAQ